MDMDDLRRKAEAGSCVSPYLLVLRYLHGIDVKVDHKEAFKLLSAAADQGASRAVLNLARMHAQGLGIPKNMPEAVRLFEALGRPSDSSDAFQARIELARIYSSGGDNPVDAEAALEWYSAAIALATENAESEELQEAREYLNRVRGQRDIL
jgi:TPR repeat protein